mmetsp:Transcript_10464/g.14657  ORF Transcript_10464/g.14657 Transcript_10464/m.14657 type:complete len:232 (+) Transcript_10464:1101-1796(+)
MPKILSISGANLASNLSLRKSRSSLVNGSVTTFKSVVGYDLCRSFLHPRGSCFAIFSAFSLASSPSSSWALCPFDKTAFASYLAIKFSASSTFLAAASSDMLMIRWHSSGVKIGASKIERDIILLLVERITNKTIKKIPQTFNEFITSIGRAGCNGSALADDSVSDVFTFFFAPPALRRLPCFFLAPTAGLSTFLLPLLLCAALFASLTVYIVRDKAYGAIKKNTMAVKII